MKWIFGSFVVIFFVLLFVTDKKIAKRVDGLAAAFTVEMVCLPAHVSLDSAKYETLRRDTVDGRFEYGSQAFTVVRVFYREKGKKNAF